MGWLHQSSIVGEMPGLKPKPTVPISIRVIGPSTFLEIIEIRIEGYKGCGIKEAWISLVQKISNHPCLSRALDSGCLEVSWIRPMRLLVFKNLLATKFASLRAAL